MRAVSLRRPARLISQWLHSAGQSRGWKALDSTVLSGSWCGRLGFPHVSFPSCGITASLVGCLERGLREQKETLQVLQAELRTAQHGLWHLLLVRAAPCRSRFSGSEMGGILVGEWQVGGGYRTSICGHVSPLPHPAGGDQVAFLSFSRRSPWLQGGHTLPLCYLGHVEFGCLTPCPCSFFI